MLDSRDTLPYFMEGGKQSSLQSLGTSKGRLTEFLKAKNVASEIIIAIQNMRFSVTSYKVCCLTNGEQAHSMTNTRARTRASHQIAYVSNFHADRNACLQYGEITNMFRLDIIGGGVTSTSYSRIVLLKTYIQASIDNDGKEYIDHGNLSCSTILHSMAMLDQVIEKVRFVYANEYMLLF